MASTMTHIGAVLRYEFLIQWRQRVALLTSIALCALCLLLMLMLHDNSRLSQFVASDAAKTLTPEQLDEAKQQISTLVLLTLYVALHFFLLLLFPIILADTFPKDKQYGVRELLDTLPLSSTAYLVGKVGGTLCSVLIALALPMLILGVGWWLLVYPYDAGAYLGMWLVALIPIALINTALCVLIASGQPTRRRAILIGIVFAIGCLLFLSFGLTTNLPDYFSPGRMLPFKYYLMNSSSSPALYGYEPVSAGQIVLGILAGILEVLFVGVLVQRWMMRRSAR